MPIVAPAFPADQLTRKRLAVENDMDGRRCEEGYGDHDVKFRVPRMDTAFNKGDDESGHEKNEHGDACKSPHDILHLGARGSDEGSR